MPSVSVIIPYYKKINYIKKTINSVLNQTFQDFEVIVVDQSPKIHPQLRDFVFNQIKYTYTNR